MDPVLLLLRIGHVGGAVIWFGGAIIGQTELATGDEPSERQRERLERADRRMRLAMRLDLPLLLLAGLTMAIGRYVR